MSLDFDMYTYDVDGNVVHVFGKNITHNLNIMAEEAGIYKQLWRPDEHGYRAKDLIKPLSLAVSDLTARSDRYKELEPSNGWGTYSQFLNFVTEVLATAKKYPSAYIEVSR